MVVMPRATVPGVAAAAARLVELGEVVQPLIAELRRAEKRYSRAAGIGHRRVHNSANLDYVRGCYHGSALSAAALAGFELGGEDDISEFVLALADHFPE